MKRNKKPSGIDERIRFLRKLESGVDVNEVIVKELIHELQTYKIELEVQNEELRAAQSELESSHNKYVSLFETAPVSFFAIDYTGVILEVNEKGSALLEIPIKKLKGHRFQEFIHPDHLLFFHSFFKGIERGSKKEVSEIQLLNRNKYVQMEGVLSSGRNEGDFVMQLALIDVTLRKKEEAKYAQQKLEQQKERLNTILETQEEERIRIAEALHNGLGQLLYATKLKMEDIKENKELKAEVKEFLDEAITATRDLSFTLMPTLLKDFGLQVILDETARRFSTKTLKLECHVLGLKERLSNIQETAAFRIIQELLNNVLKHSKAKSATILVAKRKGKVEIIVKDNGIGFDTEKVLKKNRGTGLKSIHNRLDLLNGDIKIVSKVNKGTTVTVTF
jgi:PAS domain S-box-containing protein